MKGTSALTLIFSAAFAVFFVGPPFLGKPFGPYPLMHVADVFDILTPLVLLPLYWLLFNAGRKQPPTVRWMVLFFVLTALWASGQGMHLSANSISNLMKGMEGTDVFSLSHFYDEVLSHYIWHVGVVGLSTAVIVRHWRDPVTEARSPAWPIMVAGLIHGF